MINEQGDLGGMCEELQEDEAENVRKSQAQEKDS